MIVSIKIIKENKKKQKNFEVFTFKALQNGNPEPKIKEKNEH
jgi:hypothetical protein